MPRVLIIGNSGAARECYWIFRDMLQAAPALARYYEFAGFLAWKGHEENLQELHEYALGNMDDYEIRQDDLFVIGIGKPALRRDIFEDCKKRGARFMNLVHPWTDICKSASIGEGNVFQRGCTVYTNAKVGNGNYINGACNLSHDAVIGDFNFFAPYAIILGGGKIGSCNHLGPHSVVLEHAVMGDENLLAPGSILYKGCKDHCRMMGNPALKIGDAE